MTRSSSTPLVLLLASCVAAGCGPSETELDGGTRRDGAMIMVDGGPSSTDAGDLDAGPTPDGGSTDPDGGPGCEPTSGTATGDAYCDLFDLAVMDDGSGDVRARLYGRVDPHADDGACAVIDEVEVRVGTTVIGSLDGVGAWDATDSHALLAEGPALTEMTARCATDENRLGGFGLIIRGRVDGGAFEAECADAEGGGRWPPALRVTCHENVDAPPVYTDVSVSTAFGTTTTTFYLGVPHGPGAAITAADSTVRVIPEAYAFGATGPLSAFDVSGLDVIVGESTAPRWGTLSDVNLSTMGDALGTDVCPPHDPDPLADPPPVMLVRVSGTSERGPFSTEGYAEWCQRTESP